MEKNKKMNIGDLYPVILTLTLVGMVLGIGLLVLDKFMAQTDSTVATDAINSTIQGLDDFAPWVAVIVVVVAAAIILGLVVNSFRGSR